MNKVLFTSNKLNVLSVKGEMKMYENYFEITKESTHYAEWFDYLKADAEQRAMMKLFAKEYGININTYSIWRDKLWVIPEENESLSSQFGKEREQGLAPFKKTSIIGKAFAKLNIERARKPSVPWFFDGVYGRAQSREFDYDGRVYCQFNSECEVTETPKGFVRIKVSEFYEVLGSAEKRRTENETD